LCFFSASRIAAGFVIASRRRNHRAGLLAAGFAAGLRLGFLALGCFREEVCFMSTYADENERIFQRSARIPLRGLSIAMDRLLVPPSPSFLISPFGFPPLPLPFILRNTASSSINANFSAPLPSTVESGIHRLL
jgi:hypothetical protein